MTESNIFDKIDDLITKQGRYLSKNKMNYERTLVKLFKLENLQSEKAKHMLSQLNKSQSGKRKKLLKNKKLKTPTLKPHTQAM